MTKETTTDWWINSRKGKKRLRLALQWGLAKHCYDVAERVLIRNKAEQRWPANWSDFWVGLRLSSSGNLSRKRNGQDSTSSTEFLSIASLLDVDPGKLLPPVRDWLIGSMTHLCRDKKADVKTADVELFVDYSLHRFDHVRGDGTKMERFEIEGGLMEKVAASMSNPPEDSAPAAVRSVWSVLN